MNHRKNVLSRHRLWCVVLGLGGGLCGAANAATFVVDTAADTNSTSCTAAPNDCSMRGAIYNANTNAGSDTIGFDIPGSGFQNLAPMVQLPPLTDDGTFIDGDSQPGFNGLPLLILSGSQISPANSANALTITAANCRVRGLTFFGWKNAIEISGAQAKGNQVEGCFIGTDSLGRAVPPIANETGIALLGGAQDNIIGGATIAQRNVISANRAQNILLSGADTTNNHIWGNYIGTDRYGNAFGDAEQRATYGIFAVNNASRTEIGGSQTGRGNLISGNAFCGICLQGSANNIVAGNRIGTDAGGRNAVGNGAVGNGVLIFTSTSTGNVIGGADAFARNVISGNANNGIEIRLAANNIVVANFIGLNAAGIGALPNGTGVRVNGGNDNKIGGVGAQGNIISGNQYGIRVADESGEPFPASTTSIEGNFIGTDAKGLAAMPNRIGISLDSASRNTVGGAARGARNLISGNSDVNILLFRTSDNVIAGNFIGTSNAGDAPFGNFTTEAGIRISASRNNHIGGSQSGQRNIISGHAGHGILIDINSFSNEVLANFIGVDAKGISKVPNGKDGILIRDAAASNKIGGAAAARNIISGNKGRGITISGTGCDENQIAGNFIGLNARGDALIGNAQDGIALENGAQKNSIGSSDAALRNVISGNGFTSDGYASFQIAGVHLEGNNTAFNRIVNCYIGTDASGTKPGFGNGIGVLVAFSAHDNQIGAPGAGLRNVISGQNINVNLSSGATQTKIQNNFIGIDASGRVALNQSDSYTFALGVYVSSGSQVLIGGTENGARNVISGNASYGIYSSSGASDVTIQGNFVGTNAQGDAAVPNGRVGIADYGSNTQIGGDTPAARNVVSGNGDSVTPYSWGILTDSAKVQGNFIGTDARGVKALPNQDFGVDTGGVKGIIGGYTPRPGIGAGNVISGNGIAGISIYQSSPASPGPPVLGNLIGTDFTGTKAVPNGVGILMQGSRDAVIGSAQKTGRNIISGNAKAGIQLGMGNNGLALFTRINGNYIGTDISGQKAVPNFRGIQLDYAFGTVIGGSTSQPGTAQGNLISGNDSAGIYMNRFGSNNSIYGNAIGVAADGASPLPNRAVNSEGGWGIFAAGTGINIGAPGQLSNLIANNEAAGIAVVNNPTLNLRGFAFSIRGNSIFNNGGLGIDLGDDGATPNDDGDSDSGANDLQNFPVLNTGVIARDGSSLNVSGTLDSTPNHLFAIDVYASDEADPSGYGEGQIYLGSFNVNTRSGMTTFQQSLPISLDLTGKVITATASDYADYNTSEFSQAVSALISPPPFIVITKVSGAAYASNSSVILNFDSKLQNAGTIAVKVNGQNATVQNTEINNQTLTILLPPNSLKIGDKVEVSWRDLEMQSGAKLNGNSPVLSAE